MNVDFSDNASKAFTAWVERGSITALLMDFDAPPDENCTGCGTYFARPETCDSCRRMLQLCAAWSAFYAGFCAGVSFSAVALAEMVHDDAGSGQPEEN